MRTAYWPIAILFTLICMGIFSFRSAVAGERKGSASQKVIDFEGDVVEGMNKRPLDSLSEISEIQKRRKKMHLYRKRRGFRTEIQETMREMRYLE